MEQNQLYKLALGVWVATLCFVTSSLADITPAQQAAEMLARAQSVDVKCSYLNPADKAALSSLVARAEIALVNRESVEATKATLQRGHTAGLAAVCSADEKRSVITVLGVARQASAQPMLTVENRVADAAPPLAADIAPLAPIAAKTARANVVKIRQPQETKSAAQNSKPVEPTVAQVPKITKLNKFVATADGLQHYTQLTEAYYLFLRCKGGGRQANGLYAAILDAHHNVIQSHGARAVSLALRSAKSRAGAQSCL